VLESINEVMEIRSITSTLLEPRSLEMKIAILGYLQGLHIC
jgi:hypothetical protein